MAISIVLVVALVHVFRVGTRLPDSWGPLYYSYFSDVAVPFSAYFLLCISDIRIRILRSRGAKAAVVLGVSSAAELMQAFGLPVLGRTFDPLDFVMFAAGVLLAVLSDRFLLDAFVPKWSMHPQED